MQALQDQHVLILGLGLSGLAMARWCARHGAQVSVVDSRDAPPQLQTLRESVPSASFRCAAFDAALVQDGMVRAVFKSPGLAPAVVAPVLAQARAQGLWVGGELSLFAQALADMKLTHSYAPKLLAITGTNG